MTPRVAIQASATCVGFTPFSLAIATTAATVAAEGFVAHSVLP
jgi:hypothetical protein